MDFSNGLVQVAYPGAYRTVCVKLEIQHLAVTAVEQSTILSELEGASSADAAADCAPAFKILKNLVHKWLQDATSFQNRYAIYLRVILEGLSFSMNNILLDDKVF